MSGTDAASTRLTAKLIAELQARAETVGLVVTNRCQHCRAPLFDAKSVIAHAGPVCRKRHNPKNDPGATPAKKSRTRAAATIPNNPEGVQDDHQ